MKRLWIGIVVLTFVLTAGVMITVAFDRMHQPLASKMEAAGMAALAGNWSQAEEKLMSAKADWEKIRHFTAAVADHEPLEEMDGLFVRLQVLARQKNVSDFAAECGRLASLARAMAQSQAFTWWNLL